MFPTIKCANTEGDNVDVEFDAVPFPASDSEEPEEVGKGVSVVLVKDWEEVSGVVDVDAGTALGSPDGSIPKA